MFVFAKLLPLHCDIQTFIEYAVAPYVGAWIETDVRSRIYLNLQSHPMWVRGLKLDIGEVVNTNLQSHPMWVRGLKLAWSQYLNNNYVAPYVGAWIETALGRKTEESANVAPYVGAWIETISVGLRLGAEQGRTLCGCVD